MTRAVGNTNGLPIDPSLVAQAVGPIPGVVRQPGRNRQQQSHGECTLMLPRSATNAKAVQEQGSPNREGCPLKRRETTLVLVLRILVRCSHSSLQIPQGRIGSARL